MTQVFSLGPYGGGGSSISFSAAHSKGFWYKFSAMTVPEKGPGGGVIGFCTPVREILRPNQGIIPCRRRHLSAAGDPHTVPRARSGASRGKVCYRVLAASAVLVCTCSRRTLRVATSRCGCACAVQHRLQRRTRTAVRTGATLDAGRTCYHARA